MKDFSLSSGSVPGTDHIKPGQPGWTNNHDASASFSGDDFIVSVVCDGCGSGEHSEVGANIGAKLIVKLIVDAIPYLVLKTEIDENFWERIKVQVVGQLSVMAYAMGSSLTKIVNDYFLFTFVGVLILPQRSYVFSLGDGMYAVNGRVEILGPFPDNSPPYLMYNLTGSSLAHHDPDQLRIKVNESLPTDELQHCLIGTDGVVDFMNLAEQNIPQQVDLIGPLSQFWTNSCYGTNPDAIRRRLALINKERVSGDHIAKGLLRDDTTLVVVSRVAKSIEGG